MNVKITTITDIYPDGYVAITDLRLYEVKHLFLINYETEEGKQGLTLRASIGLETTNFGGCIEDTEVTHHIDENGEICFNTPMLLCPVIDFIEASHIRKIAVNAEKEYEGCFGEYKAKIIKVIKSTNVQTEPGLLEVFEQAKTFTDLKYMVIKH